MTHDRWTSGDAELTECASARCTPRRRDERYWDALEARILAHVARGDERRAWWGELAEMVRPGLVAAAALILAATLAMVPLAAGRGAQRVRQRHRPTPSTLEASARGAVGGRRRRRDPLSPLAGRPAMQRPKQQALAFLLGAVLVGGVVGFSADRVLRRDDTLASPRGARRCTTTSSSRRRSAPRWTRCSTTRNCQYDAIFKPIQPALDTLKMQTRAGMDAILTPEQRVRLDARRREDDARKTPSASASRPPAGASGS